MPLTQLMAWALDAEALRLQQVRSTQQQEEHHQVQPPHQHQQQQQQQEESISKQQQQQQQQQEHTMAKHGQGQVVSKGLGHKQQQQQQQQEELQDEEGGQHEQEKDPSSSSSSEVGSGWFLVMEALWTINQVNYQFKEKQQERDQQQQEEVVYVSPDLPVAIVRLLQASLAEVLRGVLRLEFRAG